MQLECDCHAISSLYILDNLIRRRRNCRNTQIKKWLHPPGRCSIFSEATNRAITARSYNRLYRPGRFKQDVTHIRMMHYTGTLPTFARFLRRGTLRPFGESKYFFVEFPEPSSRVCDPLRQFVCTYCLATVYLRGDDRMNRNHVRKSCSRISGT